MARMNLTKEEANVLRAIIKMEFNDGCKWVCDGVDLEKLKNKLQRIADDNN